MRNEPKLKVCPHCGCSSLVYGTGPALCGGAGYFCIECGEQVTDDGTAVKHYRLVPSRVE